MTNSDVVPPASAPAATAERYECLCGLTSYSTPSSVRCESCNAFVVYAAATPEPGYMTREERREFEKGMWTDVVPMVEAPTSEEAETLRKRFDLILAHIVPKISAGDVVNLAMCHNEALDALSTQATELAALREAATFYADPMSWKRPVSPDGSDWPVESSPVEADGGDKARAALAPRQTTGDEHG